MYDLHTHTEFSEDASIPMRTMLSAAEERGLLGICFTDHLDMDYPSEEIQFMFDYPAYLKEITELQNTSFEKGSPLKILKGIELGMQPHVLRECTEYVSTKDFDYIIASIHVAHGVDMYANSFRRLGNSRELLDFYFEDLFRCVRDYSDYCVVGHLDVIRRYIHNKDFDYSFHRERDRIGEILKKVIQKGRGIEVNTSGLRYDLSSSTPGLDVLRLYKELGGEIVTLGSDAHVPQDVGYDFRQAAQMVKSAGFNQLCYFEKRKPYFYDIP